MVGSFRFKKVHKSPKTSSEHEYPKMEVVEAESNGDVEVALALIAVDPNRTTIAMASSTARHGSSSKKTI